MVDYNFKPKLSRGDLGWHNRGRIPHLDGEGSTQFVTFRLCDSMPQAVLEKWKESEVDDAVIRKRIEKYLDAGYGECWLRDDRVAKILQDPLLFQIGKKIEVPAWVIMPNHAHVLMKQLEGVHLPDVLHSIKSFSASKANKVLGRKGQFWQHESFDRYIRDLRHYAAVIRYIENNPVKAGLCETPEAWRWGSAFYKASRD